MNPIITYMALHEQNKMTLNEKASRGYQIPESRSDNEPQGFARDVYNSSISQRSLYSDSNTSQLSYKRNSPESYMEKPSRKYEGRGNGIPDVFAEPPRLLTFKQLSQGGNL